MFQAARAAQRPMVPHSPSGADSGHRNLYSFRQIFLSMACSSANGRGYHLLQTVVGPSFRADDGLVAFVVGSENVVSHLENLNVDPSTSQLEFFAARSAYVCATHHQRAVALPRRCSV